VISLRAALLVSLLGILPLSAQADPRTHFLLYCSGCHGVDGASAPPNVPTLRNEIGRIVAFPEGRNYIVRVPGASQAPLTDAQLTEVMNWVLQEFNRDTLPQDFQPLTAEEVTEARRNVLMDPLKYRASFYKSYEAF